MTPVAVTLVFAVAVADWGPVRTDAEGVYLPPGVVARLGSVRFRHLGENRATMSFTPDGTKIVSTSSGTITLTDSRTGLRLSQVRTRSVMRSARVRPDGWLAVIASTERPWEYQEIDPATGAVRVRRPLEEGADATVLSRDGTRLAQMFGALVKVHDTATMDLVGDLRFSISDYPPKLLTFSPDHKYLAGVFGTNWTEVREVATGNMPHAAGLASADDGVASLVFAPNGRELLRTVCGNKIDRLELLDLKTDAVRTLHEMESESRPLAEPVYASDGRTIYFARWNELFRYDVATKRKMSTGPQPIGIRRLLLSPDGTRVGTVCANEIQFWDATTLKKRPESTDEIRTNAATLDFTLDGRHVATSDYGTCQLIDATTGRVVHQLWNPDGPYLRYSPRGDSVAIHAATGLELRDRHTNAVTFARPVKTEFAGLLRFTADGTRVFANRRDEYRGWDLTTGATIGPFPKTDSTWTPSPDGRRAMTANAAVSDWHTRELVDLTTGRPQAAWGKLVTVYAGTLFHPTSREALLAGTNSRAVFVELDRRRRRWEVPIGASYVESGCFSPDGHTLAMPGRGNLTLWEVSTGRRRATFNTRDRIAATAFSPDGRTVAALGSTAPIHLWDVRGTLKDFPAKLALATTEQLWKQLHGDDAEGAFVALQRLAAAAETTVPFVRVTVPPAVAPPKAQVAAWLAALDAPAFRDREAAMKELKQVADTIEGELVAAERTTPSPEVHERLGKVLAVLYAESPAATRRTRTVELIEWCGTPAAKRLLKDWAAGAAGASLTTAARASSK